MKIDKIPKLPQRQDALVYQLQDLVQVANRLGMYDAADWLRVQDWSKVQRDRSQQGK